jgi:hypothetical protein
MIILCRNLITIHCRLCLVIGFVNFLLRLLLLVMMPNYCAIRESHNVSKTLSGVPKEDELKKL